jgi:DNA processing protein
MNGHNIFYRLLIGQYENSKGILGAPNSEIKEILTRKGNYSEEGIESFLRKKILYDQNPRLFLGECNRIIGETRKLNIGIYSISDNEYPEPLREIGDPPLVLFAKGGINYDYEKTIAIVGTRNISQYASEKTTEISQILAEEGYTIVSGMARGTDSYAHRGAIGAKGRTIAVLASDLSRVYPKEHIVLANEIIRNKGSLISETHIDQKFVSADLLRRNRIISGISKAVLIIEGSSRKGGSLAQYNHARRQNKIIFTLIPKEKLSEGATLPNKIISEGGKGIKNASEILNILEDKEIIESNGLKQFLTM